MLDEAVEQFKARKQELETEQASMKRSLSQLNQELARLAAETEQDTGARFDRIKSLEAAIRTAERQLHELSLEHQQMKENPVDPAHLRKTIREFEEVWATLTHARAGGVGQTARLESGVRRRDRQGHGQFPQCRSKGAMPRKSRVAEDHGSIQVEMMIPVRQSGRAKAWKRRWAAGACRHRCRGFRA